MSARPTIGFLSDFGLADEWVAVCKGVILSIAPEANIIDISHDIPAFDITKGAIVLADAVPYLPRGVHLAVVDPGVGARRRAVAIGCRDGSALVGPDNGLLAYAARLLGGVAASHEITNTRYMRPSRHPTFHGRDVFAPAAAHLASGVPLDALGPPIQPETLAPLPWPEPAAEDHVIACRVIDVDRFGTVRLNVREEQLGSLGVDTSRDVDLAFGHIELKLPLAKTFADVAKGRPLLLFDSSNLLSLALNQESAAERYGLTVGDRVTLRRG
ncbi:MAG: hypothetical protein C4521_10680 [Actinobacteria bacterium]|nr:MAG: hypothetical protein C4521_10680 [Actinomycetota bacterium]